MSAQQDLDLVEELEKIDSGLSDWEVEFIESLSRQVRDAGRPLTDRQRAKAELILGRF